MSPAPGTRVGAILDADTQRVRLLGYGEYLETTDKNPPRLPSPKIRLDSGQIVWGYECWWSPENEMRAKIAEYERAGAVIEATDIDVERAMSEKKRSTVQ